MLHGKKAGEVESPADAFVLFKKQLPSWPYLKQKVSLK